MESKSEGRERALRVILPDDIGEHSERDLREMLKSLREAVEFSVGQISNIEAELQKRKGRSIIKLEKTEVSEESANDEPLDPVEIALVSTIEVRKNETEGCILCGLCTDVCPWDAPTIIDKKLIVRQERCRGCGVCVAACPSRAIDMKVYETEELLELIQYVLREDVLIKHPHGVHDAVLEAQSALLNVERILSHRIKDNRIEDILHTLRRMIDRIDRMGDRLKGEQIQSQESLA